MGIRLQGRYNIKPDWDIAGRYAWHLFNSGHRMYKTGRFWWVKYNRVQKTGSRKPNPWGLYDMSGNVAEWCFDRYSSVYYGVSPDADPSGPEEDYSCRVQRGGSILDSPADMTSAGRWPVEPFARTGTSGIRVLLPEQN